MKIKTIATATNFKHPGFKEFKQSLDKFGWDHEILSNNYIAYGSKMKNAYKYAKSHDYTHLFILDGYDIVVLDNISAALDGLEDFDSVIFNAEKACWPHSEWSAHYPETSSPWKYLNGGAAFVNVEKFIKLFEDYPIKDTDNDQEKLGWTYCTERSRYNMKLDTGCKTFQSIAFEQEGDFEYRGNQLYNLINNTTPVIIHGNGKTNMDKIYKLL